MLDRHGNALTRDVVFAPPDGSAQIDNANPAAAPLSAVRSIGGRVLVSIANLLDGLPVLQRSLNVRAPYLDPLAEIQVYLLARLRGHAADDPEAEPVRRLVQLTVNAIAAGLQATG